MLRGPLSEMGKRGQFSGHETFPMRYGWLKKVVDAVTASGCVSRSVGGVDCLKERLLDLAQTYIRELVPLPHGPPLVIGQRTRHR